MAAALGGLLGCEARRELRFDSVPQGALVRLDDHVVGRTPKRLPFEHYGTRRVSMYLEGHASRSEVVRIDAPWYAHFPLDYVSDLLFGWAWHDARKIRMDLPAEGGPMSPVDIEGLLQRAESLRRAGPAGPRRPLAVSPPAVPPPVSTEDE